MYAREFYYDGVGSRIVIENYLWCNRNSFYFFSHMITGGRFTSNAYIA